MLAKNRSVIHVTCMRRSYLIPFNSGRLSATDAVILILTFHGNRSIRSSRSELDRSLVFDSRYGFNNRSSLFTFPASDLAQNLTAPWFCLIASNKFSNC